MNVNSFRKGSQSMSLESPPPPTVTAQAWSVFAPSSNTFLGGKNETARYEIASITKIMTFLTVLDILDEQRISLSALISVPASACRIKGTSSNLEEGDQLRILDLLYGMMVPSGNDSAMALALYCGKFYHESLPVIGFVRAMNSISAFLDLGDSFFQNPHGLSNRPNYSSARDVNLLAAHAMKNKFFKEVVESVEYTCEINNPSSGIRTARWVNTNKLLGQDVDGVKTGTTRNAGACVCIRIKDPLRPVFITTLKSASSEERWDDALRLAAWAKINK